MKNNKWLLVTAISLIIVLILVIIFVNNSKKELPKELNNMGYTTKNEEEAFYKKIITNNTLDSYYDDISKGKDSKYEEYYFAKESYDYIELKMSYQNPTTKTLTITSNLKSLDTSFNFEISIDNAYLLLEGNYNTEYTCSPITQRNIDDEEINNYCQEVQQEMQSFLIQRDKIMSNKKIQDIINKN